MSDLNLNGKCALGVGGDRLLSYDGNVLYWPISTTAPSVVPFRAYSGLPIYGGGTHWKDERTLIFQWCGKNEDNPNDTTEICYVYTYDIITKQTQRVLSHGANKLSGGGGIWAAQLGNLYEDSQSRTSTVTENSGWELAQVDASTGIVLVYLGNAGRGIGYLLPDSSEPEVITYDTIEAFGISIGNGVVFYKANGVLNRYVIDAAEDLLDDPNSATSRETFDNPAAGTSNLPILYGKNFGEYLVGFHVGLSCLVVHKFGRATGWQVNESGDEQAFNEDICVAQDGRIIVTASYTQGERPEDLRRWVIDRNSPQLYLYGTSQGLATQNPYAPNTNDTAPIVGTDVITRYTIVNSTNVGRAQLIRSDEWFGGNNKGSYIRGAWQSSDSSANGIIAVVAQTGNVCSGDIVQVRDSLGHSWCGTPEIAYGAQCVAIRPAPGTSNSAPLWEVTWVRGAAGTYGAGNSYARIILDDTLTPTGSQTESSQIEFGSQGFLDLDNSGEPIPTDTNLDAEYGYVRIRYATTRGDWTIGQDIGNTSVDRLIAWNDATKRAYVVWNGYTPVQSRLALEVDGNGNVSPVVSPALQPFILRFDQFLPLGQIDYETGATPGVSFNVAAISPIDAPASNTTISGSGLQVTVGSQQQAAQAAAKAALSKNTRVFRKPKSVIPSPKILAAAAGAAAVAGAVAGLFGSGADTMDEDPPVDIPECAMPGDVTVLAETPGGHAFFAVDTPGYEKLHLQHASGTHVEMRPDGGMKTKVMQRRHDITIGDHDIYVAGDCSIVTDNGYHVRTDKGDIIIDGGGGKIKIHGDADGKLTIHAQDIEFKADKSIFLNAPQVDIGAIQPANKPILSIPGKMDLYPFPCATCPPPKAFVPLYNMLPTPSLIASLSSKATSLAGAATSAASKATMLKGLSDATGLPAFSELNEQPEEYPLSSASVYTATDTIERRKFRERLFDTPDDVADSESYSTHISICVEKGDFKDTDKKLPGQIFESDDEEPSAEPAPFLAFPLASGGTVSCRTGNAFIIGTNTTFTEDLLMGHDITINNVRGHITAIHDDTRLELDAPWTGQNIESGEIKVYRLRPFKDYFGKFEYPSTATLGQSGLMLADMMKNFHSPIIEVPQAAPAEVTPGKEPEPCGAPGMVPNVFVTVQQVYASRDDWNLNKTAKSPNGETNHPDYFKYQGVFVEAVVRALGPEWGLLRKTSGEKYNNHSIDAIVYKSPTPLYNGKTYQIVDILLNAPGPLAKIQWYPVCSPTNEDIWYREG